MKTKLLIMVLLIPVLLLSACGGDKKETDEQPEDQAPIPTIDPRPQRPEELPTAKVSQVLASDRLKLDDGREVRLIGISSPKEGQPLYQESADFVRQLVEGQAVGLEGGAVARDPQDEEVFYIWAGDQLVNYAIAGAGWGNRVFEIPPSQWDRQIAQAEQDSIAQGLGIWQHSSTSLKIELIVADAPGSDEENLNGENVTFRNTGNAEANLSGFTLRDSAANLYTFGEITLAPEGSLRVLSGCGVSSENQVYWCSNQPIWDNANETIILSDASGLLVDYRIIGG